MELLPWKVIEFGVGLCSVWEYKLLVGFGLACAPVRCAHPSFWGIKHAKRALCAPAHRSFAAPPKIYKNKLFPETNCFPSGPNSGRHGRISFHWAKLHPTELHCALLSYDAPSWVTRHPNDLHCALLSYAAPYWAMLHLTKLCSIQLSYATPYLSYAAPYLSYMLHPLS